MAISVLPGRYVAIRLVGPRGVAHCGRTGRLAELEWREVNFCVESQEAMRHGLHEFVFSPRLFPKNKQAT